MHRPPSPSRPRRKAFLPIAMALVVAGGLAACSGGGGASSGKIKLVAWEFLNGPDTPSATKIIDAFNKSQSKVEVVDTQLSFDALQQKLLTGIASGNGPDIVTLGEDALSKFVSKGALEPVDDFYSNASAYPNGQVLVKAATDGAKIDGKSYGVPLNFYDALMCYNKDIFAKAGVEPPKTWDDFADIAQKLTILKNGKPVQYAIALGDQADGNRFYPPLLWNGGGGVVSDDGKTALLDDPKTISALEFWVDLVR
ncbi:MAG TPA: extracellular solute-binding protein, partial [Galbitalea sp.]